MSWFSALGGGGGATAAGSAGAASSGAMTFSSGGAGFSSAPFVSNAAPASFYSGAGTSSAGAIPSVGGGGGLPSGMQMPSMPSIGSVLEGVTALAQGIAANKQARAEAELVKGLAQENANRIYAQLSAIASRGRAIEGAQNVGDRGSSYLTYLSNKNQAGLAAKTALFEGQYQAKALKREGELRLRSGIMRAGTSLLTGK